MTDDPAAPLIVTGEIWADPGGDRSPGAGGDGAPSAVACLDGRVVAVGPVASCERALPDGGAGARRLGGPGATVLPGFVDAHTHIFAAAYAAAGVDCTPARTPDIGTLLDRIARAASARPPGAWVRATGYEETMLAERRHPTRAELDRAAPRHRVRLVHRTGHAEILNSLALAAIGVDERTAEPPGTVFGRSLEDGALDGLLIGAAHLIEAAMPPPDPATTERHVARWAAEQLRRGVTALVDAGPRNAPADWETMRGLIRSGRLPQTVAMMEPAADPGALDRGAGDDAGETARLRRGPSKSMPRVLEHEVAQAAPDLARAWSAALALGRRIAVHANTEQAVALALDAFALAGAPPGQRVEHAPVLPPRLMERVIAGGHWVVAQPGLLWEVPERYRTLVEPVRRRHLHPWGRFVAAGGRLAASTDAPVSRGTPLESIAAMIAARGGRSANAELGEDAGLSPGAAVRAWTAGAADASDLPGHGRIAVGGPADLVLLRGDLADRAGGPPAPATASGRAGAAGAVAVTHTVIGGRVVPADDRR